jgi:hypothetical protein
MLADRRIALFTDVDQHARGSRGGPQPGEQATEGGCTLRRPRPGSCRNVAQHQRHAGAAPAAGPGARPGG